MLHFNVTLSRFSRTYSNVQEIDPLQFGLTGESWVVDALARRASLSTLKPIQAGQLGVISNALRRVSSDVEWLRLVSIPTGQLSVTGVARAFGAFESAVERNPALSDNLRYTYSREIRQLLVEFAISIELPRIDRMRSFFGTRFSATPRAQRRRKLISDMRQGVFPLGAMPMDSIKDLNVRTRDAIEATLNAIDRACLATLDEQDRLRRKFEEEMSGPVDLSLVESIFSSDALGDRCPEFVKSSLALRASPYEILRVYHFISSAPQFQPAEGPLRMHFPRALELRDELLVRFGIQSRDRHLLRLFAIPYVGTQETVLACLLALQKLTGWNVSSVLELRLENLVQEGSMLTIQGFKSRTGDFTPVVVIDDKEEAAVRALSFLRARLNWMKEGRWVGQNEGRLWLGKLSAPNAMQAYASWSKALDSFCERHRLPRFSLEQLRVEVLARVAIEKGGLEAARLMAGHRSINTTAGYLDQLLLHRRNSSISLRFQQRLAASVRYVFDETEKTQSAEESLLYPIGDGSSCVDLRSPPDDKYLSYGLCEGKHCHVGEGCANRRIEIDEARMEEMLRAFLYYSNAWKTLLDENPDRFGSYDLPAMLFNMALIGVVSNGPYRHRLKEIRIAVERGQNA